MRVPRHPEKSHRRPSQSGFMPSSYGKPVSPSNHRLAPDNNRSQLQNFQTPAPRPINGGFSTSTPIAGYNESAFVCDSGIVTPKLKPISDDLPEPPNRNSFPPTLYENNASPVVTYNKAVLKQYLCDNAISSPGVQYDDTYRPGSNGNYGFNQVKQERFLSDPGIPCPFSRRPSASVSVAPGSPYMGPMTPSPVGPMTPSPVGPMTPSPVGPMTPSPASPCMIPPSPAPPTPVPSFTPTVPAPMITDTELENLLDELCDTTTNNAVDSDSTLPYGGSPAPSSYLNISKDDGDRSSSVDTIDYATISQHDLSSPSPAPATPQHQSTMSKSNSFDSINPDLGCITPILNYMQDDPSKFATDSLLLGLNDINASDLDISGSRSTLSEYPSLSRSHSTLSEYPSLDVSPLKIGSLPAVTNSDTKSGIEAVDMILSKLASSKAKVLSTSSLPINIETGSLHSSDIDELIKESDSDEKVDSDSIVSKETDTVNLIANIKVEPDDLIQRQETDVNDEGRDSVDDDDCDKTIICESSDDDTLNDDIMDPNQGDNSQDVIKMMSDLKDSDTIDSCLGSSVETSNTNSESLSAESSPINDGVSQGPIVGSVSPEKTIDPISQGYIPERKVYDGFTWENSIRDDMDAESASTNWTRVDSDNEDGQRFSPRNISLSSNSPHVSLASNSPHTGCSAYSPHNGMRSPRNVCNILPSPGGSQESVRQHSDIPTPSPVGCSENIRQQPTPSTVGCSENIRQQTDLSVTNRDSQSDGNNNSNSIKHPCQGEGEMLDESSGQRLLRKRRSTNSVDSLFKYPLLKEVKIVVPRLKTDIVTKGYIKLVDFYDLNDMAIPKCENISTKQELAEQVLKDVSDMKGEPKETISSPGLKITISSCKRRNSVQKETVSTHEGDLKETISSNNKRRNSVNQETVSSHESGLKETVSGIKRRNSVQKETVSSHDSGLKETGSGIKRRNSFKKETVSSNETGLKETGSGIKRRNSFKKETVSSNETDLKETGSGIKRRNSFKKETVSSNETDFKETGSGIKRRNSFKQETVSSNETGLKETGSGIKRRNSVQNETVSNHDSGLKETVTVSKRVQKELGQDNQKPLPCISKEPARSTTNPEPVSDTTGNEKTDEEISKCTCSVIGDTNSLYRIRAPGFPRFYLIKRESSFYVCIEELIAKNVFKDNITTELLQSTSSFDLIELTEHEIAALTSVNVIRKGKTGSGCGIRIQQVHELLNKFGNKMSLLETFSHLVDITDYELDFQYVQTVKLRTDSIAKKQCQYCINERKQKADSMFYSQTVGGRVYVYKPVYGNKKGGRPIPLSVLGNLAPTLSVPKTGNVEPPLSVLNPGSMEQSISVPNNGESVSPSKPVNVEPSVNDPTTKKMKKILRLPKPGIIKQSVPEQSHLRRNSHESRPKKKVKVKIRSKSAVKDEPFDEEIELPEQKKSKRPKRVKKVTIDLGFKSSRLQAMAIAQIQDSPDYDFDPVNGPLVVPDPLEILNVLKNSEINHLSDVGKSNEASEVGQGHVTPPKSRRKTELGLLLSCDLESLHKRSKVTMNPEPKVISPKIEVYSNDLKNHNKPKRASVSSDEREKPLCPKPRPLKKRKSTEAQNGDNLSPKTTKSRKSSTKLNKVKFNSIQKDVSLMRSKTYIYSTDRDHSFDSTVFCGKNVICFRRTREIEQVVNNIEPLVLKVSKTKIKQNPSKRKVVTNDAKTKGNETSVREIIDTVIDRVFALSQKSKLCAKRIQEKREIKSEENQRVLSVLEAVSEEDTGVRSSSSAVKLENSSGDISNQDVCVKSKSGGNFDLSEDKLALKCDNVNESVRKSNSDHCDKHKRPVSKYKEVRMRYASKIGDFIDSVVDNMKPKKSCDQHSSKNEQAISSDASLSNEDDKKDVSHKTESDKKEISKNAKDISPITQVEIKDLSQNTEDDIKDLSTNTECEYRELCHNMDPAIIDDVSPNTEEVPGDIQDISLNSEGDSKSNVIELDYSAFLSEIGLEKTTKPNIPKSPKKKFKGSPRSKRTPPPQSGSSCECSDSESTDNLSENSDDQTIIRLENELVSLCNQVMTHTKCSNDTGSDSAMPSIVEVHRPNEKVKCPIHGDYVTFLEDLSRSRTSKGTTKNQDKQKEKTNCYVHVVDIYKVLKGFNLNVR